MWKLFWNRLRVAFQRHIVEGMILRRDAERFYLVFGGHIFFQTLHAAVKLDIFTLLHRSPGLTINEIIQKLDAELPTRTDDPIAQAAIDRSSGKLQLQRQPIRIVLLGLTSAGIVKKRGDRFYNTRLTNELLSRDSKRNVISYVLLQNFGMYKAMPHFYEAILENRNVGLSEFEGEEPTFYERLAHKPELEKVFQDSMEQLSIQTNRMLAEFLDLRGIKHLVDVGGGNGTNIIALANQFPHLKATVFDFPTVCERAKEHIAAKGMTQRLGTHPGNCFADPFPQGADCFLFCHFFTIWSEVEDRQLLQKAFAALPPGGQAIVFNMMQHDDETGPLSAAVGSPYFLTLATGKGMLYTWNEYEQWMRDAGFATVRRYALPRDHGVIVGIKGNG